MGNPATYDPATCPRWPWRVLAARCVVLPEAPPAWFTGHKARYFCVDAGPDHLTGSVTLYGPQGPYRSDGPTLWPKAWREWLWGWSWLAKECRVCQGKGRRPMPYQEQGCAFCDAGWTSPGRALYRALDAPARWLMRRWPEAWLAHDALTQVAEGMDGSHIASLPGLTPDNRTMWEKKATQARAFRRYADRQLRLMLPWWLGWLAWAAVRIYAHLR